MLCPYATKFCIEKKCPNSDGVYPKPKDTDPHFDCHCYCDCDSEGYDECLASI